MAATKGAGGELAQRLVSCVAVDASEKGGLKAFNELIVPWVNDSKWDATGAN